MEKQTENKAVDTQQAFLMGLDKYPEFKPLVDEIVANVCNKINVRARRIDSEMPYRSQFTLEMVIQRLQELV